MKNPIKSRLQVESIKRLAETFLGKKNFSWWALFYASITFIATGWLPDGIAELLLGQYITGIFKIVFSVLILIFIGYKLKNAITYENKIEVMRDSPDAAHILAIFLSPLVRTKKPADIQKAIDDGILSIATFENTEWEMAIKAIEHHKSRLKTLYVFTSTQTTDLFDLFKTAIAKLDLGIEVIEFKEGGIDFENVKEVFDAIEGFYKKVEGIGLTTDKVIVDITGGQKTNSIAGAISTLALGRKFQYVSTRDKNVFAYDIGYFRDEEE